MYKRILALALCLALCMAALPVRTHAYTKQQQICEQMEEDYRQILRYTNRSTLAGYCGLAASWQLCMIGVNEWVVSYNGNNQYDAYKNVAFTSGGHRVEPYDARDYTLEAALLAVTKNGTVDAYNILVGFQRTNTRLGSIYGHSMVIYAILDGTVYFCESYGTPFGRAGTALTASIKEFADYYTGRGYFEGLIHFGVKGYAASCTEFATNMYVEVTENTAMYSQPCLPGTPDSGCEPVREVARGERLWANALYENPDGQVFYQIDDLGSAGYVPAEDTAVFRFIYDDIGITDELSPKDIGVGKTCKVKGRIASEYSTMGAVHMVVNDPEGNIILTHELAKLSGVYDLESAAFREVVKFNYLPEGTYIYNIYADGLNFYYHNGQVAADNRQIHLVQSVFRVGDAPAYTPEPLPEVQPENTDGWVRQNGTWYCYDGDTPRTGWYCYHGGDYYLQPDGSVTTGWAEIGGRLRYFSDTGCMRTGWMDTEEGRMYLLFNGEPAVGTRIIDGAEYRFDENGYLIG